MNKGYKLQTFINVCKLIQKKGYWRKWLWEYCWQWVKPSFGKTDSTIFCLDEIGQSRDLIYKLGDFNKDWFIRIFEPETKGVRAWEYGKLLTYLNRLPKGKLLDVGSGGSLMAEYLADDGWEVTSLDIENQMEKRSAVTNPKVKYVVGDMTNMDFKDRSFDVVVSISAIEHLESWKKTKMALKEMKRVAKNGGTILISSDFYLTRQKTDNWEGGKSSAYTFGKLSLMSRILNSSLDMEMERQKLIKSQRYSNFRGRYFTTAFLEGKP